MGTDIYGAVECREFDVWWAVIDLVLLGRNYDTFGLLFGVRNLANFAPIAAGRGIPADASDAIKARTENPHHQMVRQQGEYYGHTWLGYDEIRRLDWSARAVGLDQRVHRYRRTDDGQLVYEGKSQYEGNMIGHLGLTIDEVLDNAWTQGEEREWEDNGFVYRLERLAVAQAIDQRWRLLFHSMGDLAEDMGNDNVRLIAWFD